VAGYYVDANGNLNGFVAYAVPEPSTLTLLGIGLAGAVGFRWRRGGRASSRAGAAAK
jgi:PEP-CTERM motif